MRYFSQILLSFLTLVCGIFLTACQPPKSNEPIKNPTASTPSQTTNKLTIYTSIDGKKIQPLLANYAKQSGVTIDMVNDPPMSILARLKAEGENSPADVILTEDVGIFQQAIEENLLQAFNPSSVPVADTFYDMQGYWLALSYYARTAIYDSRVVLDGEISQFSDLTKEKYKQKLCLTQMNYFPNQFLTSYLVANLGDKKAKETLQGMLANLAIPVLVDDNALLDAMATGKCQIGVVNSHTFVDYLQKNPTTPIKLAWLNQQNGVPTNMMATAIAHSANQPEQALKLIEWLAKPEQQQTFADISNTTTIVGNVSSSAVQNLGQWQSSPISMRDYAEKRKQTLSFMNELGHQ